jgi:predicted nucleic acid-binding protein
MPGSFFDNNVLLYVASDNVVKADRAEEIIAGGGTISVQVLNEMANVARRKMRLSWPETRTLLSMLRGLLAVRPMMIETHEMGLSLAERYNLSIHDAMIAASAVHADCDVLLSEGTQHGMALEPGQRILNPFHIT